MTCPLLFKKLLVDTRTEVTTFIVAWLFSWMLTLELSADALEGCLWVTLDSKCRRINSASTPVTAVVEIDTISSNNSIHLSSVFSDYTYI